MKILKPGKSKIFCLCLLCATLLAGCSAGRNIEHQYPVVVYRNSAYNFDPYNREIPVEDGYVLNEGSSYEIVETETGYDLILHFEGVVTDEDSETRQG